MATTSTLATANVLAARRNNTMGMLDMSLRPIRAFLGAGYSSARESVKPLFHRCFTDDRTMPDPRP